METPPSVSTPVSNTNSLSFVDPLLLKRPVGGLAPVFLNHQASQSYQLWVDTVFTHVADRDDPSISGPQADPWGEGIPNLVRYALEIPPGASISYSLPSPEIVDNRLSLQFRRSPAKNDIAYIVEASTDLIDWTEVLYDSTQKPIPTVK